MQSCDIKRNQKVLFFVDEWVCCLGTVIHTVVRCIHKKSQLMSIHLHFKGPSNEVHFLGKMAASPEAPYLLTVALILDKTQGSPINLPR